MATVDEITGALRTARAERDEVKARLDALEATVAALEAAEEAIGGASGATTSGRAKTTPARKQRPKKSTGKRSSPKSTARKSTVKKSSARKRSNKKPGAGRDRIGPDELVDAVVALGGEATTDQVKGHLGITDGRLIAGARTSASSQGRLMVDGGLLRVADKEGGEQPGPTAAGG